MHSWKKWSFAFIAVYFIFSTATFANDSFSDIDSDFWANAEISYLEENNIIGGYSNGEFRPGNEVTRSQAAIMIAESLDLDTSNRPDPAFEDVDESYHAYDTIAAVADEGIINGDDGQFEPNEPLTRGQMAAVLTRAYDLSGEYTPGFADVDEDYIFYHDIQALAGSNITTGYASDNTFRPGESTTRAQFSVFMARIMNDEYKQEPVDTPPLSHFENRITEAEETIEMTMYEEWEGEFQSNEPKAPFEEIENTFLDYYTEDMTTTVWADFYENELDDYGPALAQAFPFRNMEDIEFVTRNNEKVVIGGTEPETELNNQATYYEYTLVQQNNAWYIDSSEDISPNNE
ncbi:S-layer homology domain-containing protein [Salibacterium salarium]|uniref:S-layer homology domain-containing protein n=1 Tax=Salibacterium salarium TaxID=284579 RepID=A0A3R9P0Q3_9BACI|nr:S-layer homology domain-containing protein [Salibacterium salarium]RSL30309.1 S-layer homology domain-containing protein [Salibacterium salarium]